MNFNDTGSGTVILNTSVGPGGLLVSNNTKTYTFGGSGNITGPTGLQKLGTGTAILNLTNNTYTGDTVISNGTLQAGATGVISPTANLVLGPSGTLELAGFGQTAGELIGAGVVDNNSGLDAVLTIGTSGGGTWSGSIQDHGHGGVALVKNGTGTWVVSRKQQPGQCKPLHHHQRILRRHHDYHEWRFAPLPEVADDDRLRRRHRKPGCRRRDIGRLAMTFWGSALAAQPAR